MLTLSIIALAVLTAQSFFPTDQNTNSLLETVDTFICIIFFADFVWNLLRTRPCIGYLKWGWLDLISSIPMFPAFRIARLARIARIIRVLRGARSSRHMLSFIFLHRARSTFGAVVCGSFILLLFSAIAIVNVEPSLSPRDAFWWCLFTLITGEYGEFYPGSTEGRIITALLMTAGVAVFGTFTASVASFFLEEEQKEDERRDEEILLQIGKLTQQIHELKQQIGDNTDGKTTEENH